MEKTKLYLGIDVGTGSVRAGLFDVYGNLVREAQHSIQIFQPAENYYEQSSDDIWEACCSVSKVKHCLSSCFSKMFFILLLIFFLLQGAGSYCFHVILHRSLDFTNP